jgi:hypothetical protein
MLAPAARLIEGFDSFPTHPRRRGDARARVLEARSWSDLAFARIEEEASQSRFATIIKTEKQRENDDRGMLSDGS